MIQKTKLVKGPAAQRIISSRYEQSAAFVVIFAPRRSREMASRSMLADFAAIICPSSCSAAEKSASKMYILRFEINRHKAKRGSNSPERIFIFILVYMLYAFWICEKNPKNIRERY